MLAWPYGLPKIMSSYAFTTPEQGPPAAGNGGFQDAKSGICGQDWLCQHRWREVYNMVDFRSHSACKQLYIDLSVFQWFNILVKINRIVSFFAAENITYWWDNGKNQFAFGRGGQTYIVFNLDKDEKIKSKKLMVGNLLQFVIIAFVIRRWKLTD